MSKRQTGLTVRQHQCLEAIREHHSRTGVMPSASELMETLGLSSKSAAHSLLAGLESRGAIRRKPGRARAIRLVGSRCPHCGGDV